MQFFKIIACLYLFGLLLLINAGFAHSEEAGSVYDLTVQNFSLSGLPYTSDPIFLAQNNNPPQAQNNAASPDTNVNVEGNSAPVELPESFHPPMKNVFLNTLFGGITGALLGIGVGTLSARSNITLGNIISHSLVGASIGAIVGCGIGVYLSQNNLYFSKQANPLNQFSKNDTHTPTDNWHSSITFNYQF